MSYSELTSGVGVVLVDHGSRFDAANELLVEVARCYQERTGTRIVEIAHMELAEPTIAQAFANCVRRGACRVVVHPYFLAPGRHSTSDIPQMAAEAASRFPEIPYAVTGPLGLDERLMDVIHTRVLEAMQFEREPHCLAP